MSKFFQKNERIFAALLLGGILFHIISIFVPNAYADETFYALVPLRLVNGDSLIQHEWHLTQFSSLFTYLPVYLWMKITGSTSGIILFLRYVYLFFHTLIACTVYAFFRKHGAVAIAAAMIFYIHIPYNMYAISYSSMFIIFLLLFTLSLFSIYNNPSKKLYIFSGFFYGACCVSNPIFCTVFFVYIVFCALWPKKDVIQESIIALKSKKKSKKKDNAAKINRNAKIPKNENDIIISDKFTCFFSREALFCSFIGLGIIMLISIAFFSFTGGSFSSIVKNLNNILNSSQFKLISEPFITKINELRLSVNEISFNMPILLPALFLALIFDKNRKKTVNRFAYLVSAFLLGILYTFGMISAAHYEAACFSLPFAVFSIVCYILTENKNKPVFYCIWCPCLFAAIISFFSSNTVLLIIGTVFAVSNIAGVFFAHDLFKEISYSAPNKKNKSNKTTPVMSKCLICVAVSFQVLIYMIGLQYCPSADGSGITKITVGPHKGTFMYNSEYSTYEKHINDIDLIKERSNENDPVMISGYQNWLYLWIERPFATYTLWNQRSLEEEFLFVYYKQNPEKFPKYIYITHAESSEQIIQENIEKMCTMFDCTREELSNGTLLTVNGNKLNFN